ncbi:uncharacterized protein JCM6883_002628 [Sporobolomyces salmoneus]|uniref:uncharacterized protein n=1 Tax=Sporobolomyces salmoneus TaxID=183962 RepID=UPI00317C9975
MGQFVNLTRLRVIYGSFDLQKLGGHQREASTQPPQVKCREADQSGLRADLASLAFEECWVSGWTNLVLPQVGELSLSFVNIEFPTASSDGGSGSFLSISHFPSLRALALSESHLGTAGFPDISVDYSLVCQLDCFVADRVYPTSPTGISHNPTSPAASLDYPIPCLFDLATSHKTTSWGYSSLPSDPTLSKSHIRIRLPCEPTPSFPQIETALLLAEALLVHSSALRSLYLDVFPQEARKCYILDKELAELEERGERLEDQAREKNVEIIWETHDDDWCRSLVSKEFWRRSKEKKEKENEGNQR